MLQIDILFLYKIQVFNGFAPCFDNNQFSLVCCKGCRDKKGMRTVACDLHAMNMRVWILAIAGDKIGQCNSSNNLYKQGDLVYLARVTDCCSLKEYGEKYVKNTKSLRKDAIYFFDEKDQQLKQIENPYHNLSCMPTDTGSNQVDCYLIKQALLSNDYYVFKAGHQLKHYVVGRNYRYKGVSGNPIARFVDDHPESFIYCENPFNDKPVSAMKIGCQK